MMFLLNETCISSGGFLFRMSTLSCRAVKQDMKVRGLRRIFIVNISSKRLLTNKWNRFIMTSIDSKQLKPRSGCLAFRLQQRHEQAIRALAEPGAA